MKRLLLAGTLLILALPAAATSDCQNLTIDGGYITGRSGNTATVHTAIVGSNLWVNVGELEADADLGVGSISHSVSGSVIGATVCPDGSVSFEEAAVEVPAPESNEGVELLTETEVEELRPETRAVYTATHPGTGGVQEF